MNQTPPSGCESIEAGIPRTSGTRGSTLLAALRWLGCKVSGLVRRVVKRLRPRLRQAAQSLTEQVPAPLRWLGRLFAPGRECGFGFWWLLATLAIALALALVVVLVLTPLAGLIALLVVAIWALVRRRPAASRHRTDPPPRIGRTKRPARSGHRRQRACRGCSR